MKESSNYLIIWNKIITITCFDSPDKHCSASTLNTIFSLTRSYQWVPCCSLSHLVLENIRNPFWGFGDMELGVILKQMRKVSAKSVAEIMLKTPVLVRSLKLSNIEPCTWTFLPRMKTLSQIYDARLSSRPLALDSRPPHSQNRDIRLWLSWNTNTTS